MNVYYQTLLQEIQELMSSGDFAQAEVRIDAELALPYIPQDALKELEDLALTCRSHLDVPKSRDPGRLDQWIHGTDVQKEMAVSLLSTLNLRMYEVQVQVLLDSDLLDEFKGELIEALMAQRLDTPFRVTRGGLEIEFVPSLIVPASQDRTLIMAGKLFDEWFSHIDPAFCSFCHRLLEQEVLHQRPLDFLELDPSMLAAAVVRLVYEAMGQPESWPDFVKANGLETADGYRLSIERQGEI